MIALEASEPDSAAAELLAHFSCEDKADELENLEMILSGIDGYLEDFRDRFGNSSVDEAASERIREAGVSLREARRSVALACERLREGTT